MIPVYEVKEAYLPRTHRGHAKAGSYYLRINKEVDLG